MLSLTQSVMFAKTFDKAPVMIYRTRLILSYNAVERRDMATTDIRFNRMDSKNISACGNRFDKVDTVMRAPFLV